MSEFEWDETKRLTNLGKHHLDFSKVHLLFDGRPSLTRRAVVNEELRQITTVANDGRFYTVIWTWRDDVRRIISYRRARYEEEWKYRDLHARGDGEAS